MAENLVIVESPAKARTIKKYLGKDFEVLASYGHVRDLVPKEGAVDPENNFAMQYRLIERNERHVRLRVKLAERREEEAIARHRVVDARPDEHRRLHRAEHTHRDEGREDRLGRVASQQERRDAGRILGARELVDGHGAQIGRVDGEVEGDAQDRAEGERAAERLLRIAHLARDVRRRVPPAVREEHRDERGGDPAGGVPRYEEGSEPARPRVVDEGAEGEEAGEDRELHDGEDVLGPLAGSKTHGVDHCERDDGRGAHRAGRPAPLPSEHRRDRRAEACREGRDRARERDPEARPPAEKAEGRAVGLSQVHVLAAGAREEAPELAVAQRPGQRDGATEEPRREERGRRMHGRRNEAADEEDPRADDAADDNQRGVDDAEASWVTGKVAGAA